MKKYLAFTTGGYRVFQFFLIPLGAFAAEALCLCMGSYMGSAEEGRSMGALLATWFLTVANVLADYWAFAGVAAKGAQVPAYLKTSSRGSGLLFGALAGQMAWTFMEAFLVLGGIAVAGVIQEGTEWLWGVRFYQEKSFYLTMLLAEYGIVEAMVLWARRFDQVSYYCALMGIASMVYAAVTGWPARHWPVLTLLVLLLFAAAISRLGIKKVMDRMRESYGGGKEVC